MMTKKIFTASFILLMISSCNNTAQTKEEAKTTDSSYREGSFGYDLSFLQKHDSVIVLSANDEKAQVIVSPKYQAKVFTSTADGSHGFSFGWVNYKAFSAPKDEHMNAYGGENRFWLGPEGGAFSLYFQPGAKMEFANWHTPPSFDTESWQVTNKSGNSVTLHKEMQITNYKGTPLQMSADRTIKILSNKDIESNTGLGLPGDVKAVGYETDNVLFNEGNAEWTEATGMPCIWMLDMLKTTPETVIVVPFKNASGQDFANVATTNYFGEIPTDRLQHNDNRLLFKADGRSRGKLGIRPAFAKPVLGSYDPQNKVLTITMFRPEPDARYLNQEWNTTKPPFSGDAVNTYNDGPLADGSQMGPFYEIESVSPAAFLKPGSSLSHKHSVYHFTGGEASLNTLAQQLLGVSLDEIKQAFGAK